MSNLPPKVPEGTHELVRVDAAPDGTIVTNASKYARQATLAAFEMIGGTQALAEWAINNKKDFYTKLFGKTIQKDIELNAGNSVDELVRRLAETEDSNPEEVLDAEFEVVDDPISENEWIERD